MLTLACDFADFIHATQDSETFIELSVVAIWR